MDQRYITSKSTPQDATDEMAAWDWRTGLVLRDLLSGNDVEAGSLLASMGERNERRFRALLAETIMSLEMQRVSRQYIESEGHLENREIFEKIIEYHSRLVSLSALMVKRSILVAAVCIGFIIIWDLDGFIVINPFLALLVLTVSPFTALMGLYIKSQKRQGGQHHGNVGISSRV